MVSQGSEISKGGQCSVAGCRCPKVFVVTSRGSSDGSVTHGTPDQTGARSYIFSVYILCYMKQHTPLFKSAQLAFVIIRVCLKAAYSSKIDIFYPRKI